MTDDFTPEQAAKLAEFDAAPTPPEIMRERVAHALWEAHVIDVDAPVPVEWPNVSDVERWRSLADAALAVLGAGAPPEPGAGTQQDDELFHWFEDGTSIGVTEGPGGGVRIHVDNDGEFASAVLDVKARASLAASLAARPSADTEKVRRVRKVLANEVSDHVVYGLPAGAVWAHDIRAALDGER